MKFDVKHFHKVHEDGRSIVLRHPKHGHQIVIAKDKLSPGMKAHFASEEQHLAQGGQVANLKENYHPEKLKAKNLNEGGECYAYGGEADPLEQINQASDVSKMADQTAAEMPQVAPELQQKREIYNDLVKQVNPKGMTAPVSAFQFGAQGEEPKEFKPEVWNKAETIHENQKLSQSEGQAADALKINQENEARMKAGLYPLPLPAVPQMPQQPGLNPPRADLGPAPSGFQGHAVYAGYSPYGNVMGDIGQYTQALKNEAAATGAMGREQVGLEQQQRQAQEQFMNDYNSRTEGIRSNIQNTLDDIKNGHINPNAYLENLSVPGKISTAIGLIMGGVGAGMTGQPSVAAQFLQNQMNRDIAAQQANLGKKESLLSGYMKQLGNERDALAMTQATMQMQYASKIREAADRQMDPIAKARAMQQAAQFEMQALPLMRQVALTQPMMAGGGSNYPEMTIQMLAPEHDRAGLFKELQTAQNMAKQKDNLLGAFDQLTTLNSARNRIMAPLQTPSKIEAIQEPLLAQLVKDAEGRITPQDTEMIKSLFPKVTDDPNTLATKRVKLNNFVSEKMNFPGLKPYGIDASRFSRYGQQGQSRIAETKPKAPGES